MGFSKMQLVSHCCTAVLYIYIYKTQPYIFPMLGLHLFFCKLQELRNPTYADVARSVDEMVFLNSIKSFLSFFYKKMLLVLIRCAPTRSICNVNALLRVYCYYLERKRTEKIC